MIVIVAVVAYVETHRPAAQAQAQYLAVYPGPAGPVNSDHLVGGDVLAIAKGSPDMSALEQFIAYMMSPYVQQLYLNYTGFIPVDTNAYGQASASNNVVPTIYSPSNATVTIYYYDDITPTDASFVQNTIIATFESEFPNIHVHYINEQASDIVSGIEALESAATNGNISEPVVMSIDNLDVGVLFYGGYLANLTSAEPKLVPSDIIKSIQEVTQYEEKVFGGIYFITERVNIPLVWVNYTALKNAGIDSLPSNLTQLMTDAKILYQKYGVGMVNFQGHGGASTATELYQWMVQFGGNPLNFNDTGDVNAIWYLANLSKYFSPEYKTSYWATYKGLASNKYTIMDCQWPGSVNLTALGMKLVNQSDNVDQVSEQAINEGVFLRTPVPWITEWQTLMDQAWTYLIEDGHGTNYTNIYNELSSMNHSLYEYLLSNYNSTVAQEYEKGEFQPLLV
ncbi:hypothetical protein GCM10007108_05550 [Thermogymnomonas acidicola]|uniref:Uncharacterized protein n=2 Tax=Thermogymnomonas acidicola TaxID=399579 RepID=A0AA37F916_9ARCH|nr:extracellular solute-binding protein [Thermogymnomonas acidicola]GGM70352.1 hypothetical protein GCM10007108_05550 [Thermogymnomonas acidicola]